MQGSLMQMMYCPGCLQADVRALQTLDSLIRASGFVYKKPKY